MSAILQNLSINENRAIAAFGGYFFGVLFAWWLSPKKEAIAGENEHQELYRLREEVGSLHYLLISVNGLLTAILVALIF